MSFYHEHRQVQLRGLKNATSQLQDGDNFLKQPVKKGLILQISVQMQPQLMYAEGQGQTPEVIAALLLEYKSVFATLEGLPPLRDHEHHITLKDGTQAISQRPYRYPYYQKNEIENIVKELLFVGFIKNSSTK